MGTSLRGRQICLQLSCYFAEKGLKVTEGEGVTWTVTRAHRAAVVGAGIRRAGEGGGQGDGAKLQDVAGAKFGERLAVGGRRKGSRGQLRGSRRYPARSQRGQERRSCAWSEAALTLSFPALAGHPPSHPWGSCRTSLLPLLRGASLTPGQDLSPAALWQERSLAWLASSWVRYRLRCHLWRREPWPPPPPASRRSRSVALSYLLHGTVPVCNYRVRRSHAHPCPSPAERGLRGQDPAPSAA